MLASDMALFFNREEFAEDVEYLAGGIEITAVVDYLQDPSPVQGGMAARAMLYVKKSDVGAVAPMDDLRFNGSVWLVESVESADDLVCKISVRCKERMATA